MPDRGRGLLIPAQGIAVKALAAGLHAVIAHALVQCARWHVPQPRTGYTGVRPTSPPRSFPPNPELWRHGAKTPRRGRYRLPSSSASLGISKGQASSCAVRSPASRRWSRVVAWGFQVAASSVRGASQRIEWRVGHSGCPDVERPRCRLSGGSRPAGFRTHIRQQQAC